MITTVIEKYLLGVDQATFQKLMNHLLHLEGYKFLGSPGSVVGKNKTSKGSPDSFFEENDKFVFCEFTTQKRLESGQTFFKKLEKDIDHCFNTSVTEVNKSDISKVILGFTEKLKANELKKLKEKVNKHNSNAQLIIYSIQEIPFRLVYYPGLADKYIAGVKTTKGTFYTLPDFLKTTEKGLQPSLTNPFLGREEEIKQAKEYLLTNDILVITGGQGVGKSKIAVQLAEIFEKELSFEPRVIASSPVPVWEDLNNFILPNKNYFIFFDDANKALPNLDYLLQFITSREANTTKIVITVRDYVKHDLNRYLSNVPYNEVVISQLEEKKIQEIVTKSLPEGKSLDPIAMEMIVTLSKGNSRLALMAASAIVNSNNTNVLNNVFSLYDQYFQKVKNDLSFLDNKENLKALGIISFFGVLEKNNDYIKKILETEFNINWNQLWETLIDLEKVELVDIFQNEVAKISDQVLATYVFYKTFIDENFATVNYSNWLYNFIDKYDRKINKTLIDLINTFGYTELRDRITSLIFDVQKKLESDTQNFYKFLGIFWFYRELDSLLFIKKWIDNLEKEDPEPSEIKYTYENNDFVYAPDYFNLLLNFWHQNTHYTKEAIDLAIKLTFKQPSRIPETLKHLNEHLQFHRYDYRFGFPRQLTLIEALSNSSFCEKEKKIADQLFLSIAPNFLGWEYHQIEGKGGGQMTIYNFQLFKTPALMELRKNILQMLFHLFKENESSVLKALHKYAWTSRSIDSSIYADEQQFVSEFINQSFSTGNYSHCKFVYEYVDTLNEHNVTLLNDWSKFLDSDSMNIAKIFSSKFDENNLNFDERKQKQKEEIVKYIKGKDIKFIQRTLEQLDTVYKEAIANNDGYWIDESLPILFQSLAETNTKQFYKSLELLMLGKYSFELNYGYFIFRPIKNKLVEVKEFYSHINRYEYKQKQFWKLLFFDALDESNIDEFFLLEFIGYISSVSNRFYIYELDKKIKFDEQFQISKPSLQPSASEHENVITYITEILLSKESEVIVSFDHHICQNSFQYFSKKVDLRKQIYYNQKKNNGHFDYDGKEMQAVSSLDNLFLIEYLNEVTEDVSFLHFKLDNLHLSFVWDLPAYEKIIDKALEIIISKAPIFSNFEHQANVLFKGLKLTPEQNVKVYNYISKFISKHFSSKQHIHIILNVVTYSFNDQILRFLKEFLLLSKDIEFMKHLWLERNEVTSGSRVPRIESHIKFTKSVVEMLQSLPNPLDYAEHLKHFEGEIEWSKKEKQGELKSDFIGWTD